MNRLVDEVLGLVATRRRSLSRRRRSLPGEWAALPPGRPLSAEPDTLVLEFVLSTSGGALFGGTREPECNRPAEAHGIIDGSSTGAWSL